MTSTCLEFLTLERIFADSWATPQKSFAKGGKCWALSIHFPENITLRVRSKNNLTHPISLTHILVCEQVPNPKTRVYLARHCWRLGRPSDGDTLLPGPLLVHPILPCSHGAWMERWCDLWLGSKCFVFCLNGTYGASTNHNFSDSPRTLMPWTSTISSFGAAHLWSAQH